MTDPRQSNEPPSPGTGGGASPPEPTPEHARALLQAGLAAGADVGSGGPAMGGMPGNEEGLDPVVLAADFPQLEILGQLGRGGMGVVFKVRQPALERLAALKVLSPRFARGDPRFAERFAREARALARLSHQNIVTVYDFGTSNDRPYLLMEFVEGTTLREALRGGPMRPDEALAIIPRLCDALEYAHGEGIVHRDIKPENILIDSRGRIKIADFGLAKLFRPGGESSHEGLTGTGAVMGTLRYMAPEQFERPGDVDQRADVYALGVVLYEMLTGEVPAGHFAPPSTKARVDSRIDDVVLRALEREPERRYQSVGQVRTGLEAAGVGGGGDSGRERSSAPGAAPGSRLAVGPAILAIVGILILLGLASVLPLRTPGQENRPAVGSLSPLPPRFQPPGEPATWVCARLPGIAHEFIGTLGSVETEKIAAGPVEVCSVPTIGPRGPTHFKVRYLGQRQLTPTLVADEYQVGWQVRGMGTGPGNTTWESVVDYLGRFATFEGGATSGVFASSLADAMDYQRRHGSPARKPGPPVGSLVPIPPQFDAWIAWRSYGGSDQCFMKLLPRFAVTAEELAKGPVEVCAEAGLRVRYLGRRQLTETIAADEYQTGSDYAAGRVEWYGVVDYLGQFAWFETTFVGVFAPGQGELPSLLYRVSSEGRTGFPADRRGGS